jgi:multiple sugar transport system substrate-binding protein
LGGVPIRQDIYTSDLAQQPHFRWMKAMADSIPHAQVFYRVTEGAQISGVLELHLHEAIAGNVPVSQALNSAADEIEKIMAKAGYKTGRLPDLK